VKAGSSGPFSARGVVADSALDEIAALPNVRQADPVVIVQTVVGTDAPKPVNIIGIRPGGIGTPTVTKGRLPRERGEVVADTALHYRLGRRVDVNGTTFTVVGTAKKITFFFGTPTLVMDIRDAQDVAFAGQPIATAFLTKGTPSRVPDGFQVLDDGAVRKDLELPTKSATQTIDFLNVLLWVIAAGIIGSMIYLSSLERTRDFAVLKATGVSNRALLFDLALQAVALAVSAAIVAALLARFVLQPVFPFGVELSARTYIQLPIIAVLVGFVASLAGLRRALGVDPALAFGGA
jgi:putative ABC transport system permease protein